MALGEGVQSTTRLLSEEGVFVRCVEPPHLDAEVMLQMSLPGGDAAVIGGVVAEVTIDPRDSGFWATFVEPDQVFLARVRAALRGVPPGTQGNDPVTSAGAGRGLRTEQRLVGRLVVKLGGRGLEPGVFALNMSSTGLFVLMPNPPEVDTVLNLSLELPDKKGPVTVLANVVRRLGPEEAAKEKTAPGAGLVFVSGSDEFRTRYDAYLKALGRK